MGIAMLRRKADDRWEEQIGSNGGYELAQVGGDQKRKDKKKEVALRLFCGEPDWVWKVGSVALFVCPEIQECTFLGEKGGGGERRKSQQKKKKTNNVRELQASERLFFQSGCINLESSQKLDPMADPAHR
jgi:hypothetical protein